MPSALDRFFSAFFGGRKDAEPDKALIGELLEAVVDVVEPKIRADRRYAQKLDGAVRSTLTYLRSLGRQLDPPLLLVRAAWVEDPRLNAFFATADEVGATMGRSKELRKFFAQPEHAAAAEAHAVLVMKKVERKVLAPAFVDGVLRQDVPQTMVSFAEPRIAGPAATEQEVRMAIGRRIIHLLGQVTLSKIIALDERSVELQEHKGYLAARLRILELARDGMQGIVDDPATIETKISEVQRELKQTVDQYIETKSNLATLDGYITQIKQVFGRPEEHLSLTREAIRLTRMGVRVAPDCAEMANTVAVTEVKLAADNRVIVLVRCPRSEMPPEEDLVANAERYL